jgi:hypothetical protein
MFTCIWFSRLYQDKYGYALSTEPAFFLLQRTARNYKYFSIEKVGGFREDGMIGDANWFYRSLVIEVDEMQRSGFRKYLLFEICVLR